LRSLRSRAPPALTAPLARYTFQQNTSLVELDLSFTQVRLIHVQAFSWCQSLRRFAPPRHLKSIHASAFHSCSWLMMNARKMKRGFIGDYCATEWVEFLRDTAVARKEVLHCVEVARLGREEDGSMPHCDPFLARVAGLPDDMVRVVVMFVGAEGGSGKIVRPFAPTEDIMFTNGFV
jgi:hypothetical protein